jgi:hypothetical protein
MIREKIRNHSKATCEDVDLTKVTDIEFYVKQLSFVGTYTPEVISEHEMAVTIPFEDARRLMRGKAKLQFAFVDENGAPRASNAIEVDVAELLKGEGYDPV